MSVNWLVGLLALFGLFLLRKKKPKQEGKRVIPINQNLMGSKYLALQPYIEAQARHETGNYSSALSTDQYNLFGMKKPVSRAFIGSKDSDNQYMTYQSYSDSVRDLMLWMNYTGFPQSVSGSAQYVAELKKRGYFTDNLFTYLKGVNSALQDLKRSGVQGFTITAV